jgi:hypothetical protein
LRKGPLDELLHTFPVRLDDRCIVEAVGAPVLELEGCDLAPRASRPFDV